MKTRIISTLAILAILAMTTLPAEVSSSAYPNKTEADDDIVVMDAFSVSSNYDRGYVAGNTAKKPDIAVTIRKRPDAIVMELTLTNADNKQEQRNRDINATIDALRAAVLKSPGLRLEERELQLRGNASKRTLFSKSGNSTSVSSVLLVADFTDTTSLFETVRTIRSTVSSVVPAGATKVTDNTVGFLLKNPDQYRREILTKIFEDLEFVKKGIGTSFEVLPSGLDGGVEMRPCSEKEVELWIDYSFDIRSVLELQHPATKIAK